MDPYTPEGMESNDITIDTMFADNEEELYGNIINKSISAWNNAGAGVKITKTKESNNTIKYSSTVSDTLGINRSRINENTGKVDWFDIIIYNKAIEDKHPNSNNFIQGFIVHELGHCFWLVDNPETEKATIMKYGIDLNKIFIPQSFDIQNVRGKY